MKRNILLLILISSVSLVKAQVGINTESPKATLQVEALSTAPDTPEGIIAPTLTRAQLTGKDAQYGVDQKGAIVYVTTIDGTASSKTGLVITTGYYNFDGVVWQPFDYVPEWIYLPSFNLPMTAIATGQTYDLYNQVYKKQFIRSGNTTWVSSNASLTQIPAVYTAAQLDFVVTYYDSSVIRINSISAAGILNYDVLSVNPTDASFINIVLLKK